MEQLPPLLANLALPAAQIQGGCRSAQGLGALGAERDGGEVLAAETVQKEQARPKLRISGGSLESTPPLLHVIVSLKHSSQRHRERSERNLI